MNEMKKDPTKNESKKKLNSIQFNSIEVKWMRKKIKSEKKEFVKKFVYNQYYRHRINNDDHYYCETSFIHSFIFFLEKEKKMEWWMNKKKVFCIIIRAKDLIKLNFSSSSSSFMFIQFPMFEEKKMTVT